MWTYRCKIKKVVDGDTVDVDIDLGFGIWQMNERVRIMGIDTPESRTRNKEEKVRGLLSKAKLKEMCPTGGTILLRTEVGNEKGKFGRILGKLFTLEGKDINQHLIENNYAVAYHGQSKDDIEAEHLKNAKILSERGEI